MDVVQHILAEAELRSQLESLVHEVNQFRRDAKASQKDQRDEESYKRNNNMANSANSSEEDEENEMEEVLKEIADLRLDRVHETEEINVPSFDSLLLSFVIYIYYLFFLCLCVIIASLFFSFLQNPKLLFLFLDYQVLRNQVASLHSNLTRQHDEIKKLSKFVINRLSCVCSNIFDKINLLSIYLTKTHKNYCEQRFDGEGQAY
jgi:hypothetical protein